MSVRVRTKQVRDAVKDLTYVVGYIEEWKGEEHIRPIGTHQQRYQLIELLTKFALDKLEDDEQRVGQTQSIDNNSEEDPPQENS